LAITICSAAFAGTAVSISALIATTAKTIAMTSLQKMISGTALIAVVGAGIYEAHQARQLRGQIKSLQQQVKQLLAENERLSVKPASPIPHLPAPRMLAAAPTATNATP
jgi:cell division protein FtsL